MIPTPTITAEVPQPAEPPSEPTLPGSPVADPQAPAPSPLPAPGFPTPADPADPDTGEDE